MIIIVSIAIMRAAVVVEIIIITIIIITPQLAIYINQNTIKHKIATKVHIEDAFKQYKIFCHKDVAIVSKLEKNDTINELFL